MIYTTIAPCKNKVGFQAIPDKNLKIPIITLKQDFERSLEHFTLLRATSVVLIFQSEDKKHKISLFPTGKILVYGVESKKLAEEFINRISKVIEKAIN